MKKLELCSELWGGDRIVETDPSVIKVRDTFYLPYERESSWGVFTSGGDIISDAVDFQGVDRRLVNQKTLTELYIDSVKNVSPYRECYYGGYINNHYGHFIVNTLPRFWGILQHRSKNVPIVCHAPGTPADWFNVPFINTIFSSLGLTPDDFVFFKEPTRVNDLIVCRTSFEEQRSAHHVYGTFCRTIGDRIANNDNQRINKNPVYFSKTQLASGVGAVVNEHEIDEFMISKGVDVVYPEKMTLKAQIEIIRERDILMGTAGSFFHTSIFTGMANIGCLNVQSQINTNYSLIDRLSKNDAIYLYPHEIRVLSEDSKFLTARYLPDAKAVAKEYYEIVLSHFSEKKNG